MGAQSTVPQSHGFFAISVARPAEGHGASWGCLERLERKIEAAYGAVSRVRLSYTGRAGVDPVQVRSL